MVTNSKNVMTNRNRFVFIVCRNTLSLQVSPPERILSESVPEYNSGENMKYTKISLCIDLLFCLVIMPLVIMLVPVERWFVHNTVFLVTLVAYLYALYFTYRRVKLPSLFMHRKFVQIILLMVVLVGVTVLLTDFPFPQEDLPEQILSARKYLRAQTVWFFFLVVTGFSLSIELIFELFRQILSRQEVEVEKNKAELALYKAQINPHFLFNTLNSLYGLVLTQSDKAESAFIMFSNILKYMYAQADSDTIPVGSELDYIHQYVDLQSLRLNRHTQVVLETQTDDEQILIPPMVLITFVENVFKYGTSSDKDCIIVIRIQVKEGQLSFETENSVMHEKQDDTPAIGIENCRRRLELLYPGRFTLQTRREGLLFKTKLTIQLK